VNPIFHKSLVENLRYLPINKVQLNVCCRAGKTIHGETKARALQDCEENPKIYQKKYLSSRLTLYTYEVLRLGGYTNGGYGGDLDERKSTRVTCSTLTQHYF